MTFVFAAEIWNFRHFHYYDYIFLYIVSVSCLVALFATEILLGACRGFLKWKKKKEFRCLSSASLLELHGAAQLPWHSLPPQKQEILIYSVAWAARLGRINAAFVVCSVRKFCARRKFWMTAIVCATHYVLAVGCRLSLNASSQTYDDDGGMAAGAAAAGK